MKTNFHAGFACLIGRPNVGKSTLLNALLGEKISIVSPKPQTTRTRIHGILNVENAQVILVDTPGVQYSKQALHTAMRRLALHASSDADLNVVIVEPRISDRDLEILDRVTQKAQGKVLVLVNKIDSLDQMELLLPTMQMITERFKPHAVIPVSALRRDGLDVVTQEMLQCLPIGTPLFPVDMHTDQAEKTICAELVREQLLLHLQQEVPHSAAVLIDTFEDDRRDDGQGLVRLEGRIIIERESQRGIVIGKAGATIKKISQYARLQIENLLGCKVYIRLEVYVDKDWTTNERSLHKYGIGFEAGL
jgi:GTPase